jgi:hypothetical protein
LGKTAIEGIELIDKEIHEAQLKWEKTFKECPHNGNLELSYYYGDGQEAIKCCKCGYSIGHKTKDGRFFFLKEIGKNPVQRTAKDDPRLRWLA